MRRYECAQGHRYTTAEFVFDPKMISRKPADMLKQYRQGVSEGEQKMRERVMLALGIPFTGQTER